MWGLFHVLTKDYVNPKLGSVPFSRRFKMFNPVFPKEQSMTVESSRSSSLKKDSR